MKKKLLKYTFWTLFSMAFLWVINTIWYKPFNIDHFYERWLWQLALKNPEQLTKAHFLEYYGIKFHNAEIDLPEDHEKAFKDLSKNLEMLNSYKRAEQSESQILSTTILGRYLENELLQEPYLNHNYPINHLNGVQIDFPDFMLSYHRIKDISDAEKYVIRVSKLNEKIDKIISNLTIRHDLGFVPPKYMLDIMLVQINNFLTKNTKDNILYLDFVNKVDKIEILPEQAKEELYFGLNSMIEDVVYPSYTKLSDYLSSLSESANDDVGIWRFPDSESYYASRITFYTNQDGGLIDELHEQALKELQKTVEKIKPLMLAEGLPANDTLVGSGYAVLLNNKEQLYADDEKGRELFLKDFEKLLKKSDTLLYKLVRIKPNSGIEICRMPIFKETYSPLFVYDPITLKGDSTAFFYVNLRHISYIRKFLMPAWLCSELLLGKHLQQSKQREMLDVPNFRKLISFSAYQEGWIAYSLEVAEELGFFRNNLSLLGKYHLDLLKVASLVIDSGIHYKHWTREQSMDYLKNISGLSKDECARIVDEIIIYPGQAWAYRAGLNKINELREKAQIEIAENFDLRRFHEIILQNGALPLDVLSKEVDKHIEKFKPKKEKE